MGASTWTNKLFNYQLFNYQLLNNYFTFITSTLCMFDKNVYKMTVVCCNYAAASHLWSVTTVLRFFGSSVCTQQWAQPFTARVLWII